MSNNLIADEITAVSRVIGLPICYHSRSSSGKIPGSLNIHNHPACLKAKRKDEIKCREFDVGIVHHRLANRPAGEIHKCPFGFTEIAVPVLLKDSFAGVLFAGPCSFENTEGGIFVSEMKWLEDRLIVLQSLAAKIAFYLESQRGASDDRKSKVLAVIYKKLNCSISLLDIAKELHLSPSRAGHLVKELFEETFPHLVNRIKMREAARMLSAGQKPVAEIAEILGFRDQNYFSRAFRSVYSMSPREYRKSVDIQA